MSTKDKRSTKKGGTNQKSNFKGGSRNKNQSRHNDRNERMEMESKTNSYTVNDPEWYSLTPEITQAVASVPFSNAVGASGVIKHPWPVYAFNDAMGSTAVPTLMSLYSYMSPGFSVDATSPVNVAAQKLYTYIRKNQSVYAPYEACDMIMYILAMNSAWEYHAWMTKLYGLLSTYSAQNFSMPDDFIEACGVDANDLRKHSMDFWGWINIFANRMQSYVVPVDMTYTKRHIYMHSNIFIDNDAAHMKAQFYQFVPYAFFNYSGYAESTGGRLNSIICMADHLRPTGELLSFYTLKSIGEIMLNALADQDIRAMSGDILKAVGDDKVMRLPTIPIDLKVSPVYDGYMLSQINNAFIPASCPKTKEDLDDAWGITQDGAHGLVMFTPLNVQTVDAGYGEDAPQFRLNLHTDKPTPEDVLEATRNMHSIGSVPTSQRSCGSEIIAMATVTNPGTLNKNVNVSTNMAIYKADPSSGLIEFDPVAATAVLQVSAFNHHPAINVLAASNAAQDEEEGIFYRTLGTLGDVDNLTYLSAEHLARIHYASLMKMFHIPCAMV